MRIPRIYYSNCLKENEKILLDVSSSNHVLRVLRLKPEAELILFDGKGQEHAATLCGVEDKRAVVSVKERIERNMESPIITHLAQALLRNEKMDWVIQKAVELGVNKITPLITEFSEIKLTPDKLQKRLQHWNQIIINACEQSGRNVLPHLEMPLQLDAFISSNTQGTRCLLHNYATTPFSAISSKDEVVTLAVGPEGGFSEHEVDFAKQYQWHIIKLGLRTMRAETAGIAAMACVQTLWGDFI